MLGSTLFYILRDSQQHVVFCTCFHSCFSKTAPNFSKSAEIFMYIRFRSSTQLTARFGDQNIFRQMQKCNLFFFLSFFLTS